MRVRLVAWVMVFLILINMLSIAVNVKPAGSDSATIRVPEDYPTIQAAIDAAQAGDTILVANGTYHERIVMDKRLSIIGQNKSSTIIDGDRAGDAVVGIFGANGSRISGLTVQNGWGVWLVNSNSNVLDDNYIIDTVGEGVWLQNSNNNTITENFIANSEWAAIEFTDSSNNTISWNTIIKSSDYGILIEDYSLRNKISNNNISNSGTGICVRSAERTILSKNVLENNRVGIWLYGEWRSTCSIVESNNVTNNWRGIELEDTSDVLRDNVLTGNVANFGAWGGVNDIDASNLIDGKPIYYWVNEHDRQIPYDAGYVAVINSTNISIRNLNLEKNLQGIVIADSCNSTVENVTLSENEVGLWMSRGGNNTIRASNITRNGNGIEIWSSSGNILSNNFVNDNLGDQRYERPAAIWFIDSHSNIITNNVLINNGWCMTGIMLHNSEENLMSNNQIADSWIGISLEGNSAKNRINNNNIYNDSWVCFYVWISSGNIIYHNNIATNGSQVESQGSSVNLWYSGYPSGGNFWSTYSGVDSARGPYQNETGSDGMGDNPYFIDDYGNLDRYPFLKADFPTTPINGAVAVVSATPNTVKEKIENVTFQSAAYDFNGSVVSYLFDYGDSSNSGWINDSTISRSYAHPGNYSARVKVRDNNGLESDWSYPIKISVTALLKPVALLSAFPTRVTEDIETVTFDASTSYDPDGSLVSYYFDYGDGKNSGWIEDPYAFHIYTEAWDRYSKVRVKDNDGLISDWSPTVKIIVAPLPPPPPENQKPIAKLSASPTTVEEYQTITFDASASYDPDGSVASYWFDYGDGTHSDWVSTPTISKAYTTRGSYNPKVKVKDNYGQESDLSSEPITLTVNTSPPLVVQEPTVTPSSPEMGQAYTITIEVENPSSVTKTVWFEVNEKRVRPLTPVVGDQTHSPDRQTKEIAPHQTYKFTFSYWHSWEWLSKADAAGGLMEIVKEAPFAPEGWDSAMSFADFFIEAGLADYGCRYSYEISSNILENPLSLSVDVVVPQSKVNYFYSSFVTSVTGGGATFAAAVFAWTGVGLVLAVGQGVAIASAWTLFDMAKDPSDFNYTSLAVPKKISISQLEEAPDSPAKSFATNLLTWYKDVDALSRSLEKYEGAKQSNDTRWMLIQLDAARNYTDAATKDLLEILHSKDQVLGELQSLGFSMNSTTVQAVRNELMAGLPQVELETFHALGYTNEEIETVQQTVLNIPDPPLVDFRSTLDMMESLVPVFINMSSYFMKTENEIRTNTLDQQSKSFHKITMSISPSSKTAKPGDSFTYVVDVVNLGNGVDDFDIVVTSPQGADPSWFSFDQTSLALTPGQWNKTNLTITVPSDWTGTENTTYTFFIKAVCQANSSVFTTVSANLVVIHVPSQSHGIQLWSFLIPPSIAIIILAVWFFRKKTKLQGRDGLTNLNN